jgi:hypothetical protein
MKRLLFAGIIFLYVTALAQTKAGKTDTVTHAVYYAEAAAPEVTVPVKEQRAASQLKTSAQKINIRPNNRRRMNLSGKEIMKMAVTGTDN